MEEQLNPLAATHLLQHTLRSLCIHDNSQWVYAVFWRILPRNYPPPKWDLQGGPYDRTRANRRNWILVWEDGFCNFAASSCEQSCPGGSSAYEPQQMKGLKPELFFKMSHEIYNFGEGLIGKVAADHSHKWVFQEPRDHEINFLSPWNDPADSHPRTWEAQFQSGIKTIALIAVREGVVQLGAVNKVMEDISSVVLLRKKFSLLESIPGVLLPHPSAAAFPMRMEYGCNASENWPAMAPPMEFYDHYFSPQVRITPSMSSLEALLSRLPSVGPAPSGSSTGYYEMPPGLVPAPRPPMGLMGMAKEKMEEYGNERGMDFRGESSSSVSYYLNATPTKPKEGQF
ncbi:protein RICE SALT SENSITIVE 3 [Phoenix dactylifera]|uniref:Protein RICE SALT SENSITIVE 3 n=1 Tax=Phoenix dactylifera TaxID=42345 RepID=A0A8B7C8K4_PHODC|nr:protein RICE SALT SENSITIVE 3 [Phoenix dactylifera]XP_008793881.2 protein RICE SALT SENSITIVE 3 [Phoenix dactylifera]